MKFTTSYLISASTFGFEEEESPFNFEEMQNKSLADLIPEIDALYGAVHYPSFECFEQNLFEGNTDIKHENKMEGNQSDLNVNSKAADQSSMHISASIIPQIAHSHAQSPEVDKVSITSFKKDDHQGIKNEFEHRQQNTRNKPNESKEIRSKKNIKGSNLLNSKNAEEMQLKTRRNETRKYRARVHRQHGVKLKRWGREEDRKVFSY